MPITPFDFKKYGDPNQPNWDSRGYQSAAQQYKKQFEGLGYTPEEANILLDIQAASSGFSRYAPAEGQMRSAISKTRFGDIQDVQKNWGGLQGLATSVLRGTTTRMVGATESDTGKAKGYNVFAPNAPLTVQPREDLTGQFGNPAFNPPPKTTPPVSPDLVAFNQQMVGGGGQKQGFVSIRRDNSNNFYGIDAQGNERKLTEQEAFVGGLGINETFVRPGQTVSFSEAQTGQAISSEAPSGIGSNNGSSSVDNNDSGASTNTPSSITGVPQLDALLDRMGKLLEDQIASGNKINPNIELEPSVIQQFISQAETEIEPYYSSQIKLLKEDLSSNLEYLGKQYQIGKESQEDKFKETIAGAREGRSGVGTIFSGARGKEEQGLASSQSRNLELSALATENSARGAYKSAEEKIGSRNLSGITTPSISSYSASNEGLGGFSPSRTLSFMGSGGVVGSLEREKLTAVQTRRNELEEAERKRRSLNFYST